MMKCKNCNTPIGDGGLFCRNCGCRIEGTSNYPMKKKSKLWIAVVALVLVVTIAVGGVVWYITKPEPVQSAYDEQITLGYNLIDKGNYKEATVKFDKAISIDEKKPDGYVGKAISKAYNNDAAEEVLEVLETGYELTGHSNEIEKAYKTTSNIYVDNGETQKALIIKEAYDKNIANAKDTEGSTSDEETDETAEGLQFFSMALKTDKYLIWQCKEGMKIADASGANERLLVKGDVGYDMCIEYDNLYYINYNSLSLCKVNLATEEVTSLQDFENDINGNPIIVGSVDNIIWIEGNGDVESQSNYSYNIDTGAYKEFEHGKELIGIYNGKRYTRPIAGQIVPLEMYVSDVDGSNEEVLVDGVLDGHIEDNILFYTVENGTMYDESSEMELELISMNLDTGEKTVVLKEASSFVWVRFDSGCYHLEISGEQNNSKVTYYDYNNNKLDIEGNVNGIKDGIVLKYTNGSGFGSRSYYGEKDGKRSQVFTVEDNIGDWTVIDDVLYYDVSGYDEYEQKYLSYVKTQKLNFK